MIGGRDKSTANKLIKYIKKETPSAQVEFISLELSSFESIKEFAGSIQFEAIDYLVNNAGVMAIPKRKLTNQGFEMQWGVNHLGHFYLTSLLWHKIQKSSFFRVINVSSIAHKMNGTKPNPTVDW